MARKLLPQSRTRLGQLVFYSSRALSGVRRSGRSTRHEIMTALQIKQLNNPRVWKIFTQIVRKLTGARVKRSYISRGRYAHNSATWRNARVDVVPGAADPQLCGEPYLKTSFVRGKFSKILYTPSTMCIEVGENWRPLDDTRVWQMPKKLLAEFIANTL